MHQPAGCPRGHVSFANQLSLCHFPRALGSLEPRTELRTGQDEPLGAARARRHRRQVARTVRCSAPPQRATIYREVRLLYSGQQWGAAGELLHPRRALPHGIDDGLEQRVEREKAVREPVEHDVVAPRANAVAALDERNRVVQ
jgi:hypothetical protein